MSVSIFDFQDQPVRLAILNELPWFCGTDVCRILGIDDASQAIKGNAKAGALGLDEDEFLTYNLGSHSAALDGTSRLRGGAQSLLMVSESGLYALVFKGRKAQARKFRKWVTAEVLPAIRKTGRYEAEQSWQATERGRLARLRELLLCTGEDVRASRLNAGQAQAIAITAQRYLESIKLEGEALGYEKLLGLQEGEAARGLLSPSRKGAERVQAVPQPGVPRAKTDEPDLPGGAAGVPETLGGEASGAAGGLPEGSQGEDEDDLQASLPDPEFPH